MCGLKCLINLKVLSGSYFQRALAICRWSSGTNHVLYNGGDERAHCTVVRHRCRVAISSVVLMELCGLCVCGVCCLLERYNYGKWWLGDGILPLM